MSSKKSILLHTLVYMLGLGASKGIAVALVPLYTRWLTQSEYAMWDLTTTSVLFAGAVIDMGMCTTLARLYIGSKEPEERAMATRTAMAVVIAMSMLFIAAGLAFGEPLAKWLLGDAARGDLIRLASISAAITVLGNIPLALLRAKHKSSLFSALCVIRALASLGFIYYFAYVRKWGVEGILVGDTLGLAVLALAGIATSPREFVPAFKRDWLVKVLVFGLPLVPIAVATLTTLVSDRYFLKTAVGLEQLAVYSLGTKVALLMSLFAQALQVAWGPAAFSMAETPTARKDLADSFRLVCLGLALLALGLSAYAPELVRLFGPPSYREAYRIVPWISLSYALQSAVIIVSTNMVIVHRTGLVMLGYLAGAASKLALNALLIPIYGISGAAAATLGAYALQIAIGLWQTRRVYPVPYAHSQLLALVVATLAAALLLSLLGPASTPVTIAIRTAVLAVFGIGLFMSPYVTTRERQQVINHGRRLLVRS